MQFLRDDDEDSSRPRSHTPPASSQLFLLPYTERTWCSESVLVGWMVCGVIAPHNSRVRTRGFCCGVFVCVRECRSSESERFATTYNLVLAGWMAGSSNLPDKRLRLLDY